jgi:hypothetical protein
MIDYRQTFTLSIRENTHRLDSIRALLYNLCDKRPLRKLYDKWPIYAGIAPRMTYRHIRPQFGQNTPQIWKQAAFSAHIWGSSPASGLPCVTISHPGVLLK